MAEPDRETPRAEPRTPTRARAVIDDAEAPEPGQMRKSEFLDTVEAVVRRTVDAELASIGTSSASCPYLGAAMARYRASPAEHVERTAQRYGGASGGVQELVAAIAARAARAARDWARDGSLTGIAGELGLTGTEEGAVAGFGGVDDQRDPAWVLARLGDGAPLGAAQRRPMEQAFGERLDGVRVHDDARGRQVTGRLGLAGLAVGDHIAVDPGRAPGGPIGRSAVVAHELAHVVQHRRGGAESSGAELEAGADRAVSGAADVLSGRRPAGTAGRGLRGAARLELRGCEGCGSSSTRTAAKATGRFSEVAVAVRAAPDPAAKEAALVAGIAAARKRADSLRADAGSASGPIVAIRNRITTETGVGRSGSTYAHLDENPLLGVGSDRIEQAYRAWAENPNESAPPWVLLAVWVKEGLTAAPVGNTVRASSADDARAIWRSAYYFQNMGADHFIAYTAGAGDNTMSSAPGAGAAHDTAFRAAIADQVRAGRLPRDVAGEIDAELTVVDAGGGQYTVTPSDRFFSLSLMLIDAYWRENRAGVEAAPQVPAGTAEADIDQLTYMRWNMGSTRFAGFLGRDMSGNADPDGTVPPLPTWAFHREVVSSEWGQPRANAIRFQLASETYRAVYEGW